METPPPIRNSVCSGECTSTRKLSSKPLTPVALLVTLTDCSASITSLDTAMGTAGPIIKVRCTPLNMADQFPGTPGGRVMLMNAPVFDVTSSGRSA